MGNIDVSSALGEPLVAEIELAGMGGRIGMDNLLVRMASPDVYKGAGLEYSRTLPPLKFDVEKRGAGIYLKVTSQQPVSDPFVTLLVELDWSTGRLLREYTFLLDPPGFKPQPPPVAAVKPQAPVITIKNQPPSTEPVMIGAAPSGRMATLPRRSVSTGRSSSGRIVIKRNDTLSKIAEQVRMPDISLERMLVALYRANAEEFDGGNMNRIRTGRILRVPSKSEIDQVAQSDAVQEIHAQANDWNAYRQQLAAASVTTREQGSGQEVSGKISAKVSDKTPPAKESAKEVVKLSKGVAPGDKATTESLKDKVNTMQEELVAKDNQLKDSNKHIAMLEKNIQDMRHLIELKGEAAVPAKPEEKQPEETQPATKPEVKTAPMPQAPVAAQSPAPVATPQPESPPPSFIDRLVSEPAYAAGLAIALLVLGGGLIFFLRKLKEGRKWEDLDTSIAEPAVSSEDGERTQAHLAMPVEAEEEVDPVSEAELFLNFGRDTQAEEILTYALEKDPGNKQILLKLLSIYFDRKDAKSFYAIAKQIQETGDEDAWTQAAAMGRRLEPGNPAYASAGVIDESAVDEQISARQEPPELDFDLDAQDEGLQTGASATLVFDEAKPEPEDSGLDFDLGTSQDETGGEETSEGTIKLARGDVHVAQEDAHRDDIEPASLSLPFHSVNLEVLGEDEDGVVDITSTSRSIPLEPAHEVHAVGAVDAAGDEDFVDITSVSHSLPLRTDSQDIAAGDISLHGDLIDITSESLPLQSAAGEAVSDGQVQLDESLFQGIDLNLGAGEGSAAGEVRDDQWNEVATKIDLAKAYQEMGNATGAHEILKEVLDEGDEQQRAAAKEILERLSA